jgi:hypothetical protein
VSLARESTVASVAGLVSVAGQRAAGVTSVPVVSVPVVSVPWGLRVSVGAASVEDDRVSPALSTVAGFVATPDGCAAMVGATSVGEAVSSVATSAAVSGDVVVSGLVTVPSWLVVAAVLPDAVVVDPEPFVLVVAAALPPRW